VKGFQGRRWSDGLWNSRAGRRLIGWLARLSLLGLWTGAIYWACYKIIGPGPAVTVVPFVYVWLSLRCAKIALGRWTRPLRWLLAGRIGALLRRAG
jgi:hypothetical protein